MMITPKILKNVEEEVLKKARKALLSGGFQNLGMRTIAEQCSISVGTLYNYFSSKEILAANVMLRDWQGTMSEILSQIQNADSFLDGMKRIYDAVDDYVQVYAPTWNECTQVRIPIGSHYHDMLVQQIAENIEHLMCQFPQKKTGKFSTIVAETLLATIRNPELSFEDFQQLFL